MASNPFSLVFIGGAKNVNFNAVADTTIAIDAAKYIIGLVVISTWSATPAAALSCTLRDAAAGGGNSLTTTTMTGMNGGSTTLDTTISNFNGVTITNLRRSTAGSLFFRVGTANGSALTANVAIYGIVLP